MTYSIDSGYSPDEFVTGFIQCHENDPEEYSLEQLTKDLEPYINDALDISSVSTTDPAARDQQLKEKTQIIQYIDDAGIFDQKLMPHLQKNSEALYRQPKQAPQQETTGSILALG